MLVRNAVAIADASAHLAYPPDLARMQDAPNGGTTLSGLVRRLREPSEIYLSLGSPAVSGQPSGKVAFHDQGRIN